MLPWRAHEPAAAIGRSGKSCRRGLWGGACPGAPRPPAGSVLKHVSPRLLTNSLATGPTPADLPQPAPAAAEAPFRVLFLGVDHPHGCAWRISMEEVGRFEIVGFVPGFGTRHPFPR